MKTSGKNRNLYLAGVVFFIILFVADGIDMALQWDSHTMPMTIRTSIHMLAWVLLTWYCTTEYQVRQRKHKEQRERLNRP